MDVQPGHCWCCENILPEHTVPCDRCPMAVYCCTQCRDRDNFRHSAVECEMFGEKKCSACGTLGKTRMCSACNSAWYCNADCQRRDFPTHWKRCQDILASIKKISSNLSRLQVSYGDFPEYFGNTMAVDFLQLENNEWSGKSVEEKQLERDYHVLSAGCGDLRNTVMTVASLPTEYQGKLHVTLNDLDPFVIARNVLFLFMLVRFAETEDIASSMTTIWYSLHISRREYDLIQTSLDELIQMSARQLHDVTKGLVSVLDKELGYLRQVWKGWQSLECRRDNRDAINLAQQRQNMFENSDQAIKDSRSKYLECLNANDRKQMEKWFEHGLFLPCDANQRDIPFNNPTLTAIKASKLTAKFGTPQLGLQASVFLHDGDFVYRYLISPKRMPFAVWDCLRVKEHTSGSHSSWMVMYHKYVTNLLQKFKSFIHEERLFIRVSLTSCMIFPGRHQSLQMTDYDRIFTSNLADYVGFPKLLQNFKPLLNSSNSYSVVVTEIMFFYLNVPEAFPGKSLPEPQLQKLIWGYINDFPAATPVQIQNSLFDYHNTTSHFLRYLRAEIMAGGFGIPALQDVPSFDSVKKCQGMRMRDFQKELNKFVPFQHRLNVRGIMSPPDGCRAVEWLLPKE
ncbi:uncharacterized protein LOC119726400 [Patiria miniata]|uniref:MYND-type domain-containing protein n=1 Tax=Patiria miniata TaxID=46514 RepID=A0A913ZS34_PATMI|nr:uncharacterized protein LOC119726400 [Patiria miniata]XP_038053992.1 uncharacterized protein LOC119726400 [Patiria miniata]